MPCQNEGSQPCFRIQHESACEHHSLTWQSFSDTAGPVVPVERVVLSSACMMDKILYQSSSQIVSKNCPRSTY